MYSPWAIITQFFLTLQITHTLIIYTSQGLVMGVSNLGEGGYLTLMEIVTVQLNMKLNWYDYIIGWDM